MLTCKPVKLLTLTLIKILKTAGLLRLGETIEMFLFTEYEFDSDYTLGLCIQDKI